MRFKEVMLAGRVRQYGGRVTRGAVAHRSGGRLRAPAACVAVLLAACGGGSGGPAPAGKAGAPADGGRAGGPVLAGVDILLRDGLPALRGARIGLITNHTGRTADGRSTIDALHQHAAFRLVALFGPEHGLRGTAEAGERVGDDRDERTGLPIHSLYGTTRAPTAAMLADLDALVFDVQDIGTRYYTYVWTMALAMRAAAEHSRRFVVLDRPNPIGGVRLDGNVLDPEFATFVGLYPVPMRHGMTAGELARYLHGEHGIGAALDVVPMTGWARSMYFDETGLPWHAPSPNMPSMESAIHYSGTCLFEGTNLSVGRGTDEPFQQIGAPWLAAERIAERLNARATPGVRIEAVRFTPRNPGDAKYANTEVAGLRFVATDRAAYDPTALAIAALVEIAAAHGDSLSFFERHFDRLAGTDRVRHAVLRGDAAHAIMEDWPAQLRAFRERRAPYLLY